MSSWMQFLLNGRRGHKESWKKAYIREQLPNLIRNISCNAMLLSFLSMNNVLGDADLDKLEMYATNRGKLEQTKLLLEIITTRHHGYEYLALALHQCKQTGALQTLLLGVEKEAGTNPYRYCGIDINLDGLLSQVVQFGGSKVSLLDVCNVLGKDVVTKKFTSYLDVTSHVQLTTGNGFVLACNNVPTQVPYYIDRSVSQLSLLNTNIFEELHSDVFTIEGIELYELTQLARRKKQQTKNTDLSSNQIESGLINVKFILLEDPDHFEQLSLTSSCAIHWVKKELSNYFHVKSSGKDAVDRVRKFLDKNQPILSVDELALRCLATPNICPIFIYDSPGMGKSVLLVELANRLKSMRPLSTVVFAKMSELIRKIGSNSDDLDVSVRKYILCMLSGVWRDGEFIEISKLASQLLTMLLEIGNHEIELLLDGFDELAEIHFSLASNLIRYIVEEMKNVRVYVSTRLHKVSELEAVFGVPGYSIVPFNESDQVSFILQYWCAQKHIRIGPETKKMAKNIIELLKIHDTDEDRKITGIPLQCEMLADLYSTDAEKQKSVVNEHQFHNSSLYTMYKNYVNMKFDSLSLDDKGRKLIYDVHLNLALALMFPENPLAVDRLIEAMEASVSKDKMYQVGILEPQNFTETPDFVHRTFGEYFAAESLTRNQSVFTKDPKSDVEFLNLLFESNLLPTKGHQAFRCNLFATESTFLHFLSCSLIDHGVGRVNLRLMKNTLMASRFYNSDSLVSCLSTAAISNSPKLFEFLMDLYFDTGISSGLGSAGQNFNLSKFFNDNLKLENREERKTELIESFRVANIIKVFLVMVIGRANILMLKTVFKCLSSVFQQNLKDFSLDTKAFCLNKAAQRGNYQVFEYLFIEFEHVIFSKTSVLHECLRSTYHNTNSKINDRTQIAKLVLAKNPALVNLPDWAKEPPILVKGAHPDLIRCLFDHGADISVVDSKGSTVFHLAILYMSAKEFHALMEHMLSDPSRAFEVQYVVGSLDKTGNSILYYATCAKRPIEVIERIVTKEYCNPSQRNVMGETFLHWFPRFYDCNAFEGIVRFLLENGFGHVLHIECNALKLPLHEAIRELNVTQKTIELMASCNVDFNALDVNFNALDVNFNTLDVNGLSPLLYACLTDKSVILMKALISAGADVLIKTQLPKLEGYTFYHILPCKYTPDVYDDITVFLVENNNTKVFHEKNDHLQHSLHKAVLNFDVSRKTLETLLAYEVDINATDKNGSSVLVHAVYGKRSVSFLKCLISMGADVMIQDINGRSFAHHIANCYSPQQYHNIVEFLISSNLGEVFNVADVHQVTSLHQAVNYFELLPETLRLLSGIEHAKMSTTNNGGLSVNYLETKAVDRLGNSLLHYAVYAGRSDNFIKLLVHYGADFLACNNHKSTLLHLSASYGYIELLKHFIDLGCSIDDLDNDGDTALQCVVHDSTQNVYEIVDYLVKAGIDKTHVNNSGKTAYVIAIEKGISDERILGILQ